MLKIVKEDDCYLLSLQQLTRLNSLISELISDQVTRLVSIPGRHVIFNLEGMEFIGSEGLKMLLRAKRTAETMACFFQLSNISAEVNELFEITNLKNHFNIIPSGGVGEKILVEQEI